MGVPLRLPTILEGVSAKKRNNKTMNTNFEVCRLVSGHWGPPPSNQPPVNGYGNPAGPGSYQGWGAPPGPQGQQMAPPQWGANYGGPPQQQGYGTYSDMYQRQSGNPGAQHPAGQASGSSGSAQKASSDFSYPSQYGSMGNYPQLALGVQEASSYGPARSYSQEGPSQGGGYAHPPPPGGTSFEFSEWAS